MFNYELIERIVQKETTKKDIMCRSQDLILQTL